MAIRKNKKRIDPRYFMNEKTELIKEELGNTMNEGGHAGHRERFTGGSIDIEPLSGEEQDASTEAYYELFEFLASSNLPGDKPSDKLQYALRWIAKFEQGGAAGEAGYPEAEIGGEEEVEPLRLSAPTEDPWKFKKRLGIGGSVHDRLGGPRHREKK